MYVEGKELAENNQIKDLSPRTLWGAIAYRLLSPKYPFNGLCQGAHRLAACYHHLSAKHELRSQGREGRKDRPPFAAAAPASPPPSDEEKTPETDGWAILAVWVINKTWPPSTPLPPPPIFNRKLEIQDLCRLW